MHKKHEQTYKKHEKNSIRKTKETFAQKFHRNWICLFHEPSQYLLMSQSSPISQSSHPMLLHSLPLPLGTPIIDFKLPDTAGNMHSTADYASRKVLIVMFICNHCPYVQAIRDRLIALQASYNPEVVQLIGINANDAAEYPDDSPEEMKMAIKKFGINFPYLIDESQEVAKNYQAQCTPDIYVFDQNRKLAYHGRLDDSWKDANNVTKQELKEAIDSLLLGQQPPAQQNASMGCSIKWKN